MRRYEFSQLLLLSCCPWASFSVVRYVTLIFLLFASTCCSSTSTEGPSFSLPSSNAPCWTTSCKTEVIEEEPFDISAASDVTSSPLHATKVSCHAKVQHLQQLCLYQLPSTTRSLEITNTSVSRLPTSAFVSLNLLRKLDLKFNEINAIEPFAFEGLSNLKRLDLSYNNISSINSSQLEGLSEVVRLKVGHNPLKYVDESILEAMPSLRALELGNTLLHCDCRLSWLVSDGSKKKRSIRLLGTPSCQSPQELRGIKLKKLSPSIMMCRDDSISTSKLEIEPDLDQVVFAGDSLRLRCKVSGQESADRIWWRKEATHYADHEDHRDIIVRTTSSNGRVESYVDIPQLTWGHSGEWTCMVERRSGNSSKAVSVYVIHHDTKYCSVNVTSNNKGHYSWPRTVAEVTVELPCEALSPPSFGHSWPSLSLRPSIKHARHYCNRSGHWHFLDTSECPFVFETTRILEHFALTNVAGSNANVLESARTLRNFTSHGSDLFGDPVDLFFLSETVRRYTQLIVSNINFHSAAQVLVDVISSTLACSKDLLKASEYPNGSCSSLLNSLWLLADQVPSMTRASTPLLDVYQVSVQPETFTGISCVWFRKTRHSSDRHFRCNTNNYSALYSIQDEVTDARVRIPSNLFSNVSLPTTESSTVDKKVRLEFFVFDSAKLFPSQRVDSWEITSPVVGVRIQNESGLSSDTNIYVTLRSAIYSHNVHPAFWQDATQNGTVGNRWHTKGCQIIRFVNSLIVFKCNRLGHYGLLQDMAAVDGHKITKGAAFKASPPGVYVGSAICCFFLMASIATWGIHYSRIATTSKNKHSFVNTWVALLFLVALFTVGVHQTEAPSTCRIIGVILHYLTTCVLLWLLVSLTNLYKRVNKVLRPILHQDEPPPDIPPPPKPMLRFYLVGWGIALIVCGISAAVNLPHYATFSYCFLNWTPSMAAFYAPSAALVIILAAFFLLTQCVLRTTHVGYSEATGNTETTELELLDAASPSSENHPEEELSLSSSTSSLSDAQHSPTTQLRAHAVTLILFLLTWASAAITTAAPFEEVIPMHSTIFSVLYAICSSSLGIFTFVYFCISRSDAMEAWRDFISSCSPPSKEDEAQLTVANNITSSSLLSPPSSQTPPNNNLLSPPNTSISSCIAPSVHSVESTHSHPTNKSSSFAASAAPLNVGEKKPSNAIHLLQLNAMHENVQYAPEMFYNPKQAGVARRFFQKQRLKQMMKQNNLEVNRADSDCNSSTVYKPRSSNLIQSESDLSAFDSSYLGLLNKVNNVNIHVDSMYTGGKHPSKSLTPELLCVLGPHRDACSIVSSVENDQHQYQVSKHHQCRNPIYYQPKHLNISRSPLTVSQIEEFEALKYNSHSVSPLFFSEETSLVESSEAKYSRPLVRGLRPSRAKRKRSTSRDRENTDRQLDSPEIITTASSRQDGMIPPLNLSHGSSTPPIIVNHLGPTPELEWLHLLHKKKGTLESSFETKLNYTEESSPYFDDLGCTDDEESVEGVALECENWERELEGRVCQRGLDCRDLLDGESEDGRSSIGTSLVPEVDPSPPPSLAASDSPFNSPIHKFHQNTPDNLSLDSITLLSPGQQISSSLTIVTPTLTLTTSTPVNTPVSLSTPSSVGSPETIQACGQESCALLPSPTTETLTEDSIDPKMETDSPGKETDV